MGQLVGGTSTSSGTITSAIGRKAGTFEGVQYTAPWNVGANSGDYGYSNPITIVEKTSEDYVLLGLVEQVSTGPMMTYSVWTGSHVILNGPTCAVYDAAGNIYIACAAGSSSYVNGIFKLAPDRTLSVLAGGNANGSADGTGSAATFSTVAGMVLHPNGNLYVAESGSSRIRIVYPASSGATQTLLASGVGTPGAITVNPATGELFWIDSGTNAIRRSSVTAPSSVLYSQPGGAPRGLCFDPTGANLYVTHSTSGNVLRYSPTDTSGSATGTLVAGNGALNHTDGTGSGASFQGPGSICCDPTGTYLYVKQTGNGAIRRIVISTQVVTTIAQGGTSGNAELLGTNAGFNLGANNVNAHLTIDPTGGHLLLADFVVNRVKKITIPDGRVSALVGGYVEQSAANFALWQAIQYPATAEYRIAQISRGLLSSVGISNYLPFHYPVRVPAGSRLALSATNNAATTTVTNTVTLAYVPASAVTS